MTRSKSQWREALRNSRDQLSADRRQQASVEATRVLQSVPGTVVLSFASFGSEIDLWALNEILNRQGRLHLPRVVGSRLEVYRVMHISDLTPSSNWGILEPPPNKSLRVGPEQLDTILVPGLGFDSSLHRIGYGKGFYDKLLGDAPQALSIGVGFSEQGVKQKFPTESHDVAVKQVSLF